MVTIEKASTRDGELLAKLGRQTLLESHGHSSPADDMEAYVNDKFSVTAIQKELNDPTNLFHILYLEGEAVGYSKFILNYPHPMVPAKAVTKLERLYFLEKFHGLKLGKQLFDFIISFSRNAGQQGLWLFVWTQNFRALRFYEKEGFQNVGDAWFKISPTHSNPNYVMWLEYVAEKPEQNA